MFVTHAGIMFVPKLGIMLCGTPKKGANVLWGASTISSRGLSTTSSRLGSPHLPSLTTLNPLQLSSSDFRSLSDRTRYKIKHDSAFGPKWAIAYFKTLGHQRPFPNGTHGFFYFHPGPTHAPVAGQLRFRVVESTKPDDFDVGHDLLDLRGGLPWSIPLPVLLQHKIYDAFASLLMRDFAPVFASIMQKIEQKELPIMTSDVNLIHSLGQPLYGDMSLRSTTYRIANGCMVGPNRNFQLLADRRRTVKGTQVGTPYTGA
jgi:hypothetical protein